MSHIRRLGNINGEHLELSVKGHRMKIDRGVEQLENDSESQTL